MEKLRRYCFERRLIRLLTLVCFFQFSGLCNGYAYSAVVSSANLPQAISLVGLVTSSAVASVKETRIPLFKASTVFAKDLVSSSQIIPQFVLNQISSYVRFFKNPSIKSIQSHYSGMGFSHIFISAQLTMAGLSSEKQEWFDLLPVFPDQHYYDYKNNWIKPENWKRKPVTWNRNYGIKLDSLEEWQIFRFPERYEYKIARLRRIVYAQILKIPDDIGNYWEAQSWREHSSDFAWVLFLRVWSYNDRVLDASEKWMVSQRNSAGTVTGISFCDAGHAIGRGLPLERKTSFSPKKKREL